MVCFQRLPDNGGHLGYEHRAGGLTILKDVYSALEGIDKVMELERRLRSTATPPWHHRIQRCLQILPP